MRKYALPAIGTFAAIAVIYFAAMWFFVWRHQVSTQDAYVQADIAAIVTKLPGYVTSIKVQDNQRVSAGDVLAELDIADVKPRADQAAALVESRKAAIASIAAKQKLQSSVIKQAQAAIDATLAEAARARADAERYRSLADRGIVSRQRFDAAHADIARAEASVARARAAHEAEQDQIGVLETSRLQAEADLKQAEAQLAGANAELANTTLRAPFDGIVGNRTVQEGQYVRAGFQLMAVVPLPSVYVIANFKETQIEGMVPGQKAEVLIDALPGAAFEAHIDSFAPASGAVFSLLPPENATGNFTKIVQRIPVKLRIDGDASALARLKAGMSAVVTVDVRDAGEGKAR